MENVKDFFKEIKDRLSSPFILSFVIAWLIVNWRIFVGLFFYSFNELNADGYASYMDLVEKNYHLNKFLWVPAGTALGYTLLSPILRTSILAYNSSIKAWESRWVSKISKSAHVPMVKFLEQRDEYESKIRTLQEVIKKEGSYLVENKQLKVDLAAALLQSKNLETELNKWKQNTDVRKLDGIWKYTLTSVLTPEGFVKTFRISEGVISDKAPDPNERSPNSRIQHFHYNPQIQELTLIVVTYPENEFEQAIYKFYALTTDDNFIYMKGRENVSGTVIFQKNEKPEI